MYKTKKYYERDKQYYISSAAKRKARLKELVRKIKEVPCADCGGEFPYYVMDFDHRGDKLASVARMLSNAVSLETLLREIAKCDIVCANCHRIRTHKPKE